MLASGKEREAQEALHNDMLRASLPIKKIVGVIKTQKLFGGVRYNHDLGAPFYMCKVPLLPDWTNWAGNYESVLKDYFRGFIQKSGLGDELMMDGTLKNEKEVDRWDERLEKTIGEIFSPFNKNSHAFNVNITPEVAESEHLIEILEAVQNHRKFPKGDDPYGLHDFGAFEVDGRRWYFKFDFYEDEKMQWGWDPLDEHRRAYRLLTIMCSSEY